MAPLGVLALSTRALVTRTFPVSLTSGARSMLPLLSIIRCVHGDLISLTFMHLTFFSSKYNDESKATSINIAAFCHGCKPFETGTELKDTVNKYIEQGCKDTSNCVIGQQYGWPMNTWEVDGVTSMEHLFQAKESFSEKIGSWDVSSVTNMRNIFSDAHSLNQDISSWITSKVTNMHETFGGASSFNHSISN